jgi:PmbA protein
MADATSQPRLTKSKIQNPKSKIQNQKSSMLPPRSQQAIADQLLDLAAQAGAEAAEVFQSSSFSRPVFFEANRIKQLESSESEGVALRLWREGCPGLAVAYGSIEPKRLVERAIAISHLTEPEPIELSEQTDRTYPDMGSTVPIEQLMAWGKEAIALIRAHAPEILCSMELECDTETTRLTNSLGLDCGYSDITLNGFVSAEWVRGDDFLSIADGQTQRDRLDPVSLAQQVLQRLEWAKQNVAPPSGKVPILFTAKAADLLWSTVAAAINGKQVLEKASPWSDRIGQQVIAPELTLWQSPTAGPFSCPFDDEGLPTQEITFIEAGVLQGFYCDRTVGRQLVDRNLSNGSTGNFSTGNFSTGNGFRPGLGSYPAPDLFNLLVQPGKDSLEELIQSLDRGIIVDQILGSEAGISGDFSINVELGYRVENGTVVGRVKDTMVTGNVYTALNHLVKLGGDVEWNGSCHTPSVILESLSTTGRME